MVDTNIPQNSIDEPKRSATLDTLLMLCVPFAVAIFTHGFVAVFNSAISIITCLIFTNIGKKFLQSEFPPKSPHSYIIGLSVSLLLPATAPWWMTILTAAFAMGVCVLPFGSPEKTPFIPSATALCFATLCWPEEIFSYSPIGDSLGQMLLYGNSINKNLVGILETLVGNVPSAMGTGCILALIGVFVFLVLRKPKDSLATTCFILAVGVMAALFPRISTGKTISVIMELCSGMILFGAIFFISSNIIAPKRTISKAVWGFASGIICMLIRYVAPFEESACFGFVIACAISDYFDNLPLTRKEKKHIKELEPYTEIEIVPSVVPEEILQEIPDLFTVTIPELTEEIENNTEEKISYESESLETVISEENTVTDNDAPFIMGGDGNE
jgi:Na+-translocating ferredoxin:NAD+ oxidoreductase RnfD subunit